MYIILESKCKSWESKNGITQDNDVRGKNIGVSDSYHNWILEIMRDVKIRLNS